MPEVLDATYIPETDEGQEEEGQGSASSGSQDIARRQFEKAKKEAIKKSADAAQKQAVKVAAKTSSKLILRIVNAGFAASIVGIIVTYFIMTFQFIVGNWLGHESIKLDLWEIIIWGFLTLILGVVGAIIILIFISLLIVGLGPVAAASILGKELFEILKDFVL